MKPPDGTKSRMCPQCDCGLYEVFINKDGEIVAVECHVRQNVSPPPAC